MPILMRLTYSLLLRESASLTKDGPAASQIGDAGGTLVTRLNSNYACMGVPPDDMIGILTQTNIQSRIRKWRDKWLLIRLCSSVLPFLNALKRKGLLRFSIQSLNKVSSAF